MKGGNCHGNMKCSDAAEGDDEPAPDESRSGAGGGRSRAGHVILSMLKSAPKAASASSVADVVMPSGSPKVGPMETWRHRERAAGKVPAKRSMRIPAVRWMRAPRIRRFPDCPIRGRQPGARTRSGSPLDLGERAEDASPCGVAFRSIRRQAVGVGDCLDKPKLVQAGCGATARGRSNPGQLTARDSRQWRWQRLSTIAEAA